MSPTAPMAPAAPLAGAAMLKFSYCSLASTGGMFSCEKITLPSGLS